MKKNKALKIIGGLGLIGSTLLSSESHASTKRGMEKCYGVAKKAKNDCATHAHACGGQAKFDSDPSEWIFTPVGLCQKLAKGSLTPPKKAMKGKKVTP